MENLSFNSEVNKQNLCLVGMKEVCMQGKKGQISRPVFKCQEQGRRTAFKKQNSKQKTWQMTDLEPALWQGGLLRPHQCLQYSHLGATFFPQARTGTCALFLANRTQPRDWDVTPSLCYLRLCLLSFPSLAPQGGLPCEEAPVATDQEPPRTWGPQSDNLQENWILPKPVQTWKWIFLWKSLRWDPPPWPAVSLQRKRRRSREHS